MNIFEKTKRAAKLKVQESISSELNDVMKMVRETYELFPIKNRRFDFDETPYRLENEVKKWATNCFELYGLEACRLAYNMVKNNRLSYEQTKSLDFSFYRDLCKAEKNRLQIEQDTQARLRWGVAEHTPEKVKEVESILQTLKSSLRRQALTARKDLGS